MLFVRDFTFFVVIRYFVRSLVVSFVRYLCISFVSLVRYVFPSFVYVWIAFSSCLFRVVLLSLVVVFLCFFLSLFRLFVRCVFSSLCMCFLLHAFHPCVRSLCMSFVRSLASPFDR